MKKIMKLMSLLFLVAATQYSCINDADVDAPDSITSDSNGNLALYFEIPNVLKDARSVESSGETETGSSDEYKVNHLTLYLFDSKTKVFMESYDLKDFTYSNTSGQNIQYARKTVIVKPGTYNIFAIANGDPIARNFTTQDQFLGAIDATTYSAGKIPSVPANGFMMSNRGAANLNVLVEDPNQSKKVTSVSISLERVVAKVEIAQTQDAFLLKDKADKTYATITIAQFRMLNLATRFYIFRHIAELNSLQEPDTYNDANFGAATGNNNYVIDPYFFKKTVENAPSFNNSDLFYAQALVDLPANMNDSNWAIMGPANKWSLIYCLENCMYSTAQLNAYTTGVMFKARFDPDPDHVFDEKGVVSSPSNWPDRMFYVAYNFYTSIEAIRKNTQYNIPSSINDNSSTQELEEYKIKRFNKTEHFSCYYNYWIKHLESPVNMDVMEFGTVRNNIYRLLIKKVKDLGTDEPSIKPTDPDEKEAELDVNIDVFPWVVRNQDIELE